MNIRRALSACAFSTCAATLASANDWPKWRGPAGDNVSRETGWSAVGADAPLWRASIGRGYSSPSIADGRLFITGYFEGEDEPDEGVDRVSCLDAETGKELWSHTYPALSYKNEHNGGALSTSTVHAGTVYVPTRKGEVRAFEVEDGTLLWEVDLALRHEVSPGRYGFASSPLVLGDTIVLNAARTVRLDRATGETIWISEDFDANYSTVAPIRLGERECLATFGGEGLVILDAATGEEVHTYVFRKTPRNVEGSTPIVMDERVFVSTAYEQGGALVDFSGDEPVEVWRTRAMRNKMAGCTLWDGHLYGFDESMLKCLDLAGEERWRKRGLGHGALTIADGRLLVTTSNGELIVATATPEEYREESRRVVIEDGGVFWTGPILVNGRIYVRGSFGDLVCLDHRGRAQETADVTAAAATTVTGTAELPSPEALVRGHLVATGLAEKKVPGVRMTGRLHIKALGFDDVEATWETAESGNLHVRFALPPAMGGFIERFYDGVNGWEVNPYRGDVLMKPDELTELHRTGGLRALFDPLPGGDAVTVGREVLHGTPCYRVDLVVAPDVVRHVYFDARTGLLAGRTGAEESTVLFGDWRRVDGVLLPFQRTVFDPETGEEQRWRFQEVTLETFGDELFVMPEKLREELGQRESEGAEEEEED